MQSLASKKAFQNSLRALMVAGSIGGFMGGWAFLAHAAKPVASGALQQAAAVTLSLPSLAPYVTTPSPQPQFQALPPLTQPSPQFSQGIQPLPSLPTQQFAMPRLRSRGS
jgi:hypothetical protein